MGAINCSRFKYREEVATIIGNYLTSTFFMLIILLILFIRSSTLSRQSQSRLRCRSLILMTMCYVLLDGLFITCDLTDSCPNWLFGTVVFVFYIAYVMLPFIWQRFVRNFVNLEFHSFTHKLEYVPVIVLLGLVILSPFTGVLWSIGDDCTYIRGPLFTFFSYLNFFYYIEPFIYAIVICIRKTQKENPWLLHSLMISLIPLVSAAVNSLVIPIYQIFPFQPFCSVLVALLGYMFIAAREADHFQMQHQQEIQQALNKAQEATQKALEASKVKTTFLSNMSHDIRTPMNAILNLTQLARKEDDIKTIKKYLGKMEISENFLLGLINDILDMSKIESGELTLKKERLTRSEFLNTVGTVIQPLMDANHINFHSELRPGEYTILVDKLRFNQIFFNLLSNAAKFTPEGGDVWFTVTNKEHTDNKLKIEFKVRDNGIGMSEDFLDHLFEPFAREHSELGKKKQGTGLGLPIVKSLVDAMGGTIDVKSELGKGTEFIVEFFVDIAEYKDYPLSDVPKTVTTDLTGTRVLLVEDNELNTYVAKTILEDFGCNVTTAGNGQEALDTFTTSASGAFDIVLMDVRMPVMDGLTATKAIRSSDHPDAQSIPIVAMTADVFDDEKQQTVEAGMNYHLPKPISADSIHEVLTRFVSK